MDPDIQAPPGPGTQQSRLRSSDPEPGRQHVRMNTLKTCAGGRRLRQQLRPDPFHLFVVDLRQLDCLRQLVVVLCERSQLQDLVQFSYVNLHDEVTLNRY